MVSKSLIHKKKFEKINTLNDLPPMNIEQIADILIKDPRGIPNYVKYEEGAHPVNFRNVLEGTRKDIIFHYTTQGRNAIYGEPREYEGIIFGNIIDYESSEKIIKVDHVSFFTKIKENSSEHRIYQIGARYKNKKIYDLESKIREQEKLQNYEKLIELRNQLIDIDPDYYCLSRRMDFISVKRLKDKFWEHPRKLVKKLYRNLVGGKPTSEKYNDEDLTFNDNPLLSDQKSYTSLETLKENLEKKKGKSLSRSSINGFIQKLRRISALNIFSNPKDKKEKIIEINYIGFPIFFTNYLQREDFNESNKHFINKNILLICRDL